jgi:hypothetical protein
MKSHTKARARRYSILSPHAAVLCLLLSAGCESPFADLGEERTITIRVSGTVSSAVEGAPISGATVTLDRIVLAADTGSEILAHTTTGVHGQFSVSRQIRCTSFALFEMKAWKQGYSSASETVGGCTDVEKVIHVQLPPLPAGQQLLTAPA